MSDGRTRGEEMRVIAGKEASTAQEVQTGWITHWVQRRLPISMEMEARAEKKWRATREIAQ